MKFLLNSLAIGAGTAIGSQISQRVTCRVRPYPMPYQFAKVLDHPLRMRYRDPEETLGLFGVNAGMTVLDLGCGTGTFTVEMARRIGENGVVHAVDLQQPLIEKTRSRLEEANLADRVQFHLCGAYRLDLEDDSVDLAMLVATLSQIPEPSLALAELRRVLRPGARLAVSEEMPDPAYVPPNIVRRWAEDAGFTLGGRTGSIFCYQMVFFNHE